MKLKKSSFQSLPKQDFENMKEAAVHFIKVFKNWSLETGGSFEKC